MIRDFLLCVVGFAAVTRINASSITDVKSLFTDLMTGYNTDVRPIADQNNILDVSVKFFLNSIRDFDEVSETLSILGAFAIQWEDASLVWDPASYGGLGEISMAQNKVWLPKLFNIKASNAFKAISDSDYLVKIYSNGQVFWQPGGFIDVKCSPDVSYFPFDRQTCSIHLAPWGYLKNQVILKSPQTEIFLDYYESNGIWSLDKTVTGTDFLSSFSIVTFDITISRLPAFHIVNTVMPIYLLLVMNPLVFMLPCDSGERVGFSLTVFLTFTVFITIVNSVLPATSENMSKLSYFIFAVLVASGIIASTNIFQLRMYHKDESLPVPQWLVNIMQILDCQCKKSRRNVIVVCPENAESKSTNRNNKKKLTTTEEKRAEDTEERMTWKDVVRILDKVFICLSYAIITVSSIVTLVIMSDGNS